MAVDTGERNSIQKNVDLFIIKASKGSLSICGDVVLSILLCGYKNLSTKFKVEINTTVEYFNLSGHSYKYVMVRPRCLLVCL